MTTLQMYDRFRAIYQEKSSRYFEATLWAPQIINDGIDHLDAEIADQHPEFMGMLSTTVGYTAQAQEVALPAGLVEIAVVEVTDRGGPPFPRLYPAEFRDRTYVPIGPGTEDIGGGFGEPSRYYVRGQGVASDPSLIGWLPIPARTAAGNVTVWFHGSRVLVGAIDGTIPDLPLDWHSLVPYWMAVLAAGAEEKSNVGFYVGIYNSRLELKKAAALRGRQENAPELVEVVDEAW